jgi:hypothetical protein
VRERILLARNSDKFFNSTLRTELDPTGGRNEEEIRAAIRAASAQDILDALPEGLDTEMTDGGREFSGGQLQRLRLVRALLAGRDVTLLVEPTSAVDAHTEARIAERLAEAHAHRDPRAVGALAGALLPVPAAVAAGPVAHAEAPGGPVPAARAAGHTAQVETLVAASAAATASLPDADRLAGPAPSVSAIGSPEPALASALGPSASAAVPPRLTRASSTTVVFTTSPLLLDRAHRVAYVEDGRVVAVGSHRELLASEPRYASVVTRGEDLEESA